MFAKIIGKQITLFLLVVFQMLNAYIQYIVYNHIQNTINCWQVRRRRSYSHNDERKSLK